MSYNPDHAFGTYYNNTHWKFYFAPLTKRKYIPGVIRGYLRKYPRDFIADVEVEGIKFRCYPFQNCHDAYFFSGSIFQSEAEEFAFLEGQARKGGNIVDIGANTGAISIPLALRYQNCTILAIEPDPINVARLSYNSKINDISNIVIAQCAVGEKNYSSHLWINLPFNRGGNSLLVLENINQSKIKDKIKSIDIEVKLLTDILKENNMKDINLLKIDVEGYEDRALIPFFQSAERSLWPRAVIIEHLHFHMWKENCIDWMINIGYSIEIKNEVNTMLTLNP
jgi:FkbM family methyltransferase